MLLGTPQESGKERLVEVAPRWRLRSWGGSMSGSSWCSPGWWANGPTLLAGQRVDSAARPRIPRSADEQLDRPSLVSPADADVVQPAVVAQGHGAAGVDLVLADTEVGLC